MRKWMHERFKRRKKEKAESPSGAPAPLQPKYFESDAPTPESAPKKEESAPQEAAPADEPRVEPPAAGTQARPAAGRRRRRGRGGRGRGSSSAAAPSSSPPAAAPPQPAGAAKGVVVLAIGLPGSGKSSWFKRHNITPLSSDLLRVLLFDDPTEQRFQDLIFSNLRSMLRARLIAGRPMNYVDATNLSPHERANWIKLAHDHHYEVQAVFFDVPVEICLERNRKRQRSVPEDVMHRMAGKLQAPTFEEGFTKITVVKVKKQQE
ncbi:MAG TPA: AAA family ATPase [Terriglobales bacterium]|nr:AAA family ATPase [Terriglobales bacterium]